ncbi:hypothetical protein ACP93_02830 [Xanthomonas sp. NCPPB 1128]|nr:hypothetical protein ACP93_02830 [Xanthomonas sp. NCPPB 1128]
MRRVTRVDMVVFLAVDEVEAMRSPMTARDYRCGCGCGCGCGCECSCCFCFCFCCCFCRCRCSCF